MLTLYRPSAPKNWSTTNAFAAPSKASKNPQSLKSQALFHIRRAYPPKRKVYHYLSPPQGQNTRLDPAPPSLFLKEKARVVKQRRGITTAISMMVRTRMTMRPTSPAMILLATLVKEEVMWVKRAMGWGLGTLQMEMTTNYIVSNRRWREGTIRF